MRKQTVNKNACLVLNLHILYQTGLPHACGKLASRKHTKKNMFPHSACGSQTKNVCQAGGLEFLGYPFLGILNSKFDQLSASSGSFMPTMGPDSLRSPQNDSLRSPPKETHLEHHFSTHLGHHRPQNCERVVTGGHSLRSPHKRYYILLGLDMGT